MMLCVRIPGIPAMNEAANHKENQKFGLSILSNDWDIIVSASTGAIAFET